MWPPAENDRLDPECFELCDALNRLPGIRTDESCCGHGRDCFEIYFQADNLTALPNVVRWFSSCCTLFPRDWTVEVWQGCEHDQLSFIIRGWNLKECYQQSRELARRINDFLKAGCEPWLMVQNRRWLRVLNQKPRACTVGAG
jgi:hypothetical protein